MTSPTQPTRKERCCDRCWVVSQLIDGKYVPIEPYCAIPTCAWCHTTPNGEVEKRCAKCGSPFEGHHWRHYSPRTGKTFHTGCFEQYKFPSLLDDARSQLIASIRKEVEQMKFDEDVIADAETESHNAALDDVLSLPLLKGRKN